MEEIDFDGKLDFSEIDEFNEENRLENSKDNEQCEIDWSEANSDEQEGSIWNEINWNDGETGEQEESIWNEIDWEESENEKQTKSDSNDADGEIDSEQLDPNKFEENYEGNEYEQYERESDDELNYDSYDYGDNFEQEEYSEGFYENSYAEVMNTILLSENQIYEYIQEFIKLMGEVENEVQQEEQAEVENSNEEISELAKFLEEERERIRLEQQQADLDEIIENDPKSEIVTNDEEVEQEQKEEVDTQINSAEENFSINEEELKLNLVEEHQANLEEIIEYKQKAKKEEVENQELKPEVLQADVIEGNLEEREYNLKLDNDENEKYENYQVESKIKEEFEIESELIVDEEELVSFEEEHKEEAEYEELNEEQDYKVIEEFENSQQELEAILEQNRIIEQQYLLEIERKESISDKLSNENYERTEELYRKETGKRPLYANKETKGFKEWLMQSNEFRGKLKGEQSMEQKVEQEKDNKWMLFLKNWIKKECGEEIKLKNEIIQIIEKYSELDELATKFQKLYEKEQLSHSEKMELKASIKTLQKSDPHNIVLFTNLRALKRYLIHKKPERFSDKMQINQILTNFFTQLSPMKQLNKILKSHEEKKILQYVDNQQIQPIAKTEKGISTKTWGALRKLLWTEIDKFIKSFINILQKFENYESNDKYKKLTSILLAHLNKKFHLSKQRLSQERINLLKKAIITIYLLNLKNPPSQAEIRRITKFTGNRQIKEIREHLKMNLSSSYLRQSYLELIASVELNRDQISKSILQLINKNLKELLETANHQKTNREFFLTLIREIYINLKNTTDSLNYLNITQLQKIPIIIYNTIKDKFTNRKIYREEEFIENISNLYGFLYLGRNLKNKKVYVGQTTLTIEEEWGDILKGGKAIRKKRQENPNMKISARYIHNAIAKYGLDVWELKLIDIAYKKSELDAKEIYYVKIYDSMNPAKGYNLTTGGRTGGRLSPATKKKVSESVQNVWNSPGYRERLGKAQSKSWESEERREKNIKGLLKSWENEERRQQASEQAFKRWEDEEISEKMKLGLSMSAKKKWQNPTEAMLKNLQNMHQKTRKEIINIKEFLIDIKNTKEQREFWQADLFNKYGIKSHMTLNSRIKEILGGFGVNNHGEAHRFFYDRSLDEVMKYLDNPKGYNIFRDPFTEHFFIDVKNSKKGADLHNKYRVWHKNGLITKIKRIVGVFGINNYTSLKMFLQDKGINQSLKYFENLEKNL